MSTRPDVVTEDEDTGETTVTAHNSSPDRTVFTEKDNADAWIATDLTVDLWR
ncbi:MAG: hypothetical protein ABEH35_02830 [Haloarculaceae archaeon]